MCALCMSRRRFVTMLGVAGSSTLVPRAVLGQTKPYRLDVHYHHIAPAWIGEDAVATTLPPLVIKQAREWTPQRAIEEMDRNAVETAVCSVSNPGIWFGNVSQGRRLARACNEYAAQIGRDHLGRFGSFAALPLPDTDGSLSEIAYAFDNLKADGVGLFTSYGDKWIADPAFAPVFDELNRRNAVVYVHPIAPACCRSLIPGMPAAVIEYPIDTTRAILQWVMTKSTERYPNIRIIFSHAGGLIIAGIGRLSILIETQPLLRQRMPENLPNEIGKLYYEISSSSDPVTMTALRAFVPNSHILLGTDSPFGPMSPTIDQLQALGLSKTELTAIERDNALALMPRLG
jgi:predicted TIM-barrel fold metal-dependent hydrolase